VLISVYTVGTDHLSKDGWIWDSGVSCNMMHDKGVLHNYVEFRMSCKVKMGDDNIVDAPGQGDLLSTINVDGEEIQLYFPNVLHVPKLGINLLSQHATLKSGYMMQGKEQGILVQDEETGDNLLLGQTKGSLCYVPLNVQRAHQPREHAHETAAAATIQEETTAQNEDKCQPGQETLTGGSAPQSSPPLPAAVPLSTPARTSSSPPASPASGGSPSDTAPTIAPTSAAPSSTAPDLKIKLTFKEAHQRFGHIRKNRLLTMLERSADVELTGPV
jgi:hypothetical protein